ncbi:MAG: hypothetical protein NTW58_04525 [Actinobacteria bacterium]|nr:hypothetical protein [Actinomycetota bacterium]
MRNALIVLVVVALVLVVLGAVNNGLLFDIDFVAGTWTAVSLFWVTVVAAGVVVVSGVAAALLAQSGAVATRRRLEKELQGTYERLRAAEAKLPRPVPVEAVTADVIPGDQTAVTGVVSAPLTDETSTAEPEAETAVVGAAPEAETAVVSAAPSATATADAADAPAPAAT